MQHGIPVPTAVHALLVRFAARHAASVEDILAAAVAAYIADVDASLLAGPGPAPTYRTRLSETAGRVARG